MRQSSYEVIEQAIRFERPERLPIVMPSIGISDVHWVNWNQIGTGDETLHQTIDEWGCVWSRTDVKNMGQVIGNPLREWSALERFEWPDPTALNFYEGMENQFEGCDGKFVMTKIFMLLFERMHSLRGFANTLIDLATVDQRIEMLADRIVEFDLAVIENISQRFPGQIHAMYFTEDWGTEQSTIISLELWRSFFASRYERIFNAIHEAGWYVWMHSCGRITSLVDDLIELGVDVLNLQQPQVLGVEAFGKRFAGRVCFESLCDIQRTLPFKGKEEIQAEAELLLKHWATSDGGFILGDYGENEAIGVSMEKIYLMLDAFRAADRWRQ